MEGDDHRIERFIEKPVLNVAEELLKNRRCYWNSGIFYFNVPLMIDEYRQSDPVLLNLIQQSLALAASGREVQIDGRIYAQIREVPFDKLVMERGTDRRVIPFKGTWSDIGSWDSISSVHTGQPTSSTKMSFNWTITTATSTITIPSR